MSPPKKKMKQASPSPNKRRNNLSETSSCKQIKSDNNEEETKKNKKGENFVAACKQVSGSAFFNHQDRLLLTYLPTCLNNAFCTHQNQATPIQQIKSSAKESFKIEMKNNMWYEALEVCHMCINPVQYLSADILKDIVEIMLNAHEDEFSEHSVKHIIFKSQQILSHHFNTHPPCSVKGLRECYEAFLISPMDPRGDTFTNRNQYKCQFGIATYCMNRLEYELKADSKDGPLIDHHEIPEEMREGVKCLHWRKQKIEIFELLDRKQRIERLMAVLEAIIELLQFDLAIYHSRYIKGSERIMRSRKPLMAAVLWRNNVLFTGAVNAYAKQIITIFSYMVHLNYPASMLRVICKWLNTMIQTFYIFEKKANCDYPNIEETYCTCFAKEFYKIISGLPSDSMMRILEHVEPTYMKYLLGIQVLNKILSTDDQCIITIIKNFVDQSQWKLFSSTTTQLQPSSKLFRKPKKVSKKLNYILIKCNNCTSEQMEQQDYLKFHQDKIKCSAKLNVAYVIHMLFLILKAYLDSYNIQYVKENWERLNEQLLDENYQSQHVLVANSEYTVTENFIRKYRDILREMKELQKFLGDVKNRRKMPKAMDIFGNIL